MRGFELYNIAMKKTISTDELISKYLKDNPAIKKALKIFDISSKEYRNTIKSMQPQKTFINTKSTNI